MRRWLPLVGLLLGPSACLVPGDSPLLAARDTNPPTVVSTDPSAGGTVASAGTIQVLFSEAMAVRTLRPGIAIFEGRTEVPLTVTVPPSPTGGEEGDPSAEVPYTVTVGAESGTWKTGTAYTLVLRMSLTDTAGNALQQEVRVPFRTNP